MKHSETFKYGWMFFIGFMLKLYDDLDELYMIKNPRLMSCLQTSFTIMMCYWLFVIASTKYEIVMFTICYMGTLYDWEAFTSDPFVFSTFLIVFLGLTLLLLFCRGHTFGIGELFMYIMIYTLVCLPVFEVFLFKYNGFLYEVGKYFHIFGPTKTYGDDDKYLTLINLSETEYEVSNYKLLSRSLNILVYVFWMYVLHKCMTSSKTNINHALQSLIYMIMMFLGYMILSVVNQANVLYFHPEVVEMHKKNNNET